MAFGVRTGEFARTGQKTDQCFAAAQEICGFHQERKPEFSNAFHGALYGWELAAAGEINPVASAVTNWQKGMVEGYQRALRALEEAKKVTLTPFGSGSEEE